MNDVQYIAFRCSTLTWIPLQISQKHSSDLPPSAFYFFYSFLICQQVRRRCSGQTVKPQEELLFKGIKEAEENVQQDQQLLRRIAASLYSFSFVGNSVYSPLFMESKKKERLEQSQNYSCSLRVLILRHSIQSQRTLEKKKKNTK